MVVYTYVEEANPTTRWGCQLADRDDPSKGATNSSVKALYVASLEAECSEYESCIGYYANGNDKGTWVISTDVEPISCQRPGGMWYTKFWRKTRRPRARHSSRSAFLTRSRAAPRSRATRARRPPSRARRAPPPWSSPRAPRTQRSKEAAGPRTRGSTSRTASAPSAASEHTAPMAPTSSSPRCP